MMPLGDSGNNRDTSKRQRGEGASMTDRDTQQAHISLGRRIALVTGGGWQRLTPAWSSPSSGRADALRTVGEVLGRFADSEVVG